MILRFYNLYGHTTIVFMNQLQIFYGMEIVGKNHAILKTYNGMVYARKKPCHTENV